MIVQIKVRATFSATCHKEHLDGLGDEAIAAREDRAPAALL